ncbi:RsmB/NOP family class I SAM-dependent RNA methyltransferase [Bradyrhizobium sp. U87765 SZCCT0131]|uniref:RsmB/NOP family class I SAM-dependent RNA methyltransferase n=1 Tax=unclassified Bradyrhizobium TaxID=2631580 RepID=UPI001BAB6A83|nr:MULTISPECIES: RsmB/NOP family class I SAM-dependent RNA methyltransferase [unclassified Bradyrhizobium]MBR1220610.1 RsmB/NOP family class I SAM-dependent RNA methyltransferase [Bradyrhizobium sp. U87765 SZCCT0131]MBR1262936.1 RsmB/NOP family class I SAM-dependent RNA methyltransferase [Bradyrhizobium sp. U87765 SZCCT0134]MBR1307182.1 RsmB/NOP family class I SAM-dependent RNA methyltransferase [Bradyrhizobium sp. U87765 SZCCT0110]MBR1322931.1 RsmB/NOP family class I SAM-dependent RNA methyltr
MTPAARLSAAIEVLSAIDAQRIPAASALKDWGTAHRFAGSGDRAAIAGLVFDVLRRRASSAYLLDADTPRGRALGMLRLERGLDDAAIAALCDGSRFAPEPLTDAERTALATRTLDGAPAHIAGDYPEWLEASLTRVFGDARAEEAAAMARRAPLDLRVNTLKSTPDKALAALKHLGATPTSWSSLGLRIALGADARNPGVQAEEIFIKGGVEVQDEGSQIAALLTAAKPGEQVIDLCAGAGGKTLALAAMMQGRGRLIATDHDKRQLAPIHERLSRAGVHNAEVRAPKGAADPLADIRASADLVVIDAPCTGTGTWRRNPDAKWRMRPGALEVRLKGQAEVLDRAADLVRPGGRIVYITCSVLAEENGDQVRAFLARQPSFTVISPTQVAAALGDRADAFLAATQVSAEGLLMTPRGTGTDGFFVSVLRAA